MSAGRTIQLLSTDTSFIQGFHKTHAMSAVAKGLACWATARAWALVVSVVF